MSEAVQPPAPQKGNMWPYIRAVSSRVVWHYTYDTLQHSRSICPYQCDIIGRMVDTTCTNLNTNVALMSAELCPRISKFCRIGIYHMAGGAHRAGPFTPFSPVTRLRRASDSRPSKKSYSIENSPPPAVLPVRSPSIVTTYPSAPTRLLVRPFIR